MEFISPWWLAGLAAVGAAALWALFRPGRQLAVVGSLAMWQKAADSLDSSALRASRKITASWLAVLLGSIAAVLALAQPVLHTSAPARRLAVEVYPAAELAAGNAMDRFRKSAMEFLARLNPQDGVKVVLPPLLRGRGDYLSPDEARLLVEKITVLPIPVQEMSPYAPQADVQHTYRFGPPGLPASQGPNVTALPIPAGLMPGISAVGARGLPDGRLELLVTVTCGGGANASPPVSLDLLGLDESGRELWRDFAQAVPGTPMIRVCAKAAAVWVTMLADGKSLTGPFVQAGLVRRDVRRKKVYLLGADEPKLRQYVKVDPLLELTGDANAADVFLASRADLPPGSAGVAFAPPSPPEGWQAMEAVGPILLADAGTLADDPVMRNVNFAGVAVRRARPWKALDAQTGVTLAACKGGAIAVRNDPASVVAQPRPPRRVYLAFDAGGENSSFSSNEAFVIFLANAVRWIAADSAPGDATSAAGSITSGDYVYETPRQAGTRADWKPLAGSAATLPMPWPGLYRDSAGMLHAVNLLVPADSAATFAASPADAKNVILPPPQPAGQTIEFWPWLTLLSLLLCLAGWALRVR